MILTSIIVGAILTAGLAGIVAAFWNDILDFLRGAINHIKNILKKVVLGSRILIRKLQEGLKEISKSYAKENGHWEEITSIRTISESEVPKDILEKASLYEDVDITDELEMNLESA